MYLVLCHCAIRAINDVNYNETHSHTDENLQGIYRVCEKNGMIPPSLWSPKVRTFWENDPNKSCKNHEELFFGDLELNLEGHLKVIIEFLNGNPLFDTSGFEKGGKFYVRIRCHISGQSEGPFENQISDNHRICSEGQYRKEWLE